MHRYCFFELIMPVEGYSFYQKTETFLRPLRITARCYDKLFWLTGTGA